MAPDEEEEAKLSLLEAIDEMILVGAEVFSWEEAVKLAGELLVKGKRARREYIDAMIKTVKEMGPYAVIAPGIAIPHARPEDGALGIGFSIVILNNPVEFGSPNDPVYAVIGFSAMDKKSHLHILQQLANLLSNQDFVEHIKKAKSPGEVKELIENYMHI